MATRLATVAMATVAMATSVHSHHYTIHVSMHDGCMDAYRSKLLLPERFICLGLLLTFCTVHVNSALVSKRWGMVSKATR